MHILTKVIDEYKSKTHKGKVLNEYIVYLMVDNITIEARTAFGKEQKDLTVLDIIKKYSGNTITTEETN
jgi:hypothetical protein